MLSQLRFVRRFWEGKAAGFEVDASDMLRFRGRLYVPDDVALRKAVLSEAHDTPYSVHPGGDKMYQDLRLQFWWPNMRGEIAAYVSRCLTFQQVKFDHKRPGAFATAFGDPHVEVGVYFYGFCYGFT